MFILDIYLRKLSPQAIQCSNFYVQPAASFDTSKPWYTSRPIEKDTLASMVKEICLLGNIPGQKTNHSLRATGMSDPFQAGVPDKIIQQRSAGHLSMDGLWQYQHTTVEQQENVLKVLGSACSYVYQNHSIFHLCFWM